MQVTYLLCLCPTNELVYNVLSTDNGTIFTNAKFCSDSTAFVILLLSELKRMHDDFFARMNKVESLP